MNQVQHLEKQILVIKGIITKIQEECKHPNSVKTSRTQVTFSGDEHYIDHYCPDCNKKWEEPDYSK